MIIHIDCFLYKANKSEVGVFIISVLIVCWGQVGFPFELCCFLRWSDTNNLELLDSSALSVSFCEISFRHWKVTSLSLVVQWGPLWLQHKSVVLTSVCHCSEGTVGYVRRRETWFVLEFGIGLKLQRLASYLKKGIGSCFVCV